MFNLESTINMMKRNSSIASQAPTYRFFELLLIIAFFFSGATSLTLEVAWSKELSYLLGVDIYSTTTVVTSFMAGLGLGALLAARFPQWIRPSLKTYGLLQVVIGLCAIISIPFFRFTQPLFSFMFVRLGYDSLMFLFVRFIVVFTFMMIPVTLMGMTLPVVVSASYHRVKSHYAYLAGKLYGVNTLGAVVGTLISGFLLIPAVGILTSCLIAGALDLIIGCILIWNVHHQKDTPQNHPASSTEKRVQPVPVSSLPARISLVNSFSWPAAVFLLSGISALAYEIIWFRLLARIIGPSVHAFSIMLSIYLLGLSVGSLIGADLVRRIRDHRLTMAVLLGIIGFIPLSSLYFINDLPIWYGMFFVRFTSSQFSAANLVIQAVTAGMLILPTTVALGAFFPVVTRDYTLKMGEKHIDASVGNLYFFNTIGGVIGSLVSGFWLIPTVGIKTALICSGGLSVAIAVAVLIAGTQISGLSKLVYSGMATALFIVFLSTSPGMDQKILNAGLYSMMLEKEHFSKNIAPENRNLGNLLYFQEGINNSVAVVANKFNDGNLTLHLSGSWEASTEIHGRIHLKFLAHLPMLFAKNTETVGVIGFGAGITTGTTLLYPDVKRVHVFELESAVIDARKYFAFVNNKPIEDPRTRLFMVDGRSHITYGQIQYDIITSDPIHPFVAGASNLYTYDYYRIMASHLNPGGIFCQWIPFVRMSSESYNTILNSMHRAFPHIAIFSFCGESVIIASKEPLRADWKTLEKRFYSPNVYADLKMLDVMTPYNLVVFFVAAEDQIDQYLSSVTQINTDDNVWLEHRIPMDFFDAHSGYLFKMLSDKIPQDNGKSLEQVFSGIPIDKLPVELAALKKDGDNDYKRAQQAYERNDLDSMEKYLRRTLADYNSSYIYPAGLQLMDYLIDANRIDEVFSVAAYLQINFPAFPEAYITEAHAWEKFGDHAMAEQTMNRASLYMPDQKEMLEWRNRFKKSA
jgi:spermidine synthase